MFLGLSLALTALVVDQLTKWYILDWFDQGNNVQSFCDFFNLTQAWNTGVSFSMFNQYGSWGAIIIVAFALSVVGFLLQWLRNESSRLGQIGLGFVIGGALGNVVDRVRFGAVFDFLDFHYEEWHWPAFNMADVFICVGVFLILLGSILNGSKKSLKEVVK